MRARGTFTSIGLGAGAVLVATLVTIGTVARPAESGVHAAALGMAADAADELPHFGDCRQLHRWYVERAMPMVGPWGFGRPTLVYLDSTREPLAASTVRAGTADSPQAVGSSPTGTNVQEAGVDEADIAKTDGRLLVRVQDRSVVVTDVSTDQPRVLSRVRIPGPWLQDTQLLLVGDTVLVEGTESSAWGGPVLRSQPRMPGPFLPPVGLFGRTHLLRIDVSDPAAPVVTDDLQVDGRLVTALAYGDGTVRAVVSTGPPQLAFVHPGRGRTMRQATRLNRRIVRAAPIGAWLPGIRSGHGPRRPLLSCRQVRHPRTPSGFGTISVLTFDAGRPAAYAATGVTAAGDLAYSSADRLYVATRGPHSTDVHAFSVDGRSTPYLGSGTVPGWVRDRWSLDEYDGHLRVATTLGGGRTATHSAVLVLDGAMHVVGRLDGLGRREEIRSVRWFDDLAVLVTFRQTDPLYTVDLSSPAHPRLLGALRIRGFSAYLHPVGGDRLLGIGEDATRSGTTLGAQAAVFDLRDPHRVRRSGRVGFGAHSESPVTWDPRAFTYLPDRGVALVPVSGWEGLRTRVLALAVGADGSLTAQRRLATLPWTGTMVRTLPLRGHRVALVAGGVRILHVGGPSA